MYSNILSRERKKKVPWLRERIKIAYLESKKVLGRRVHYIANLQAGRGIKQLVRAEQEPTSPAHYSEHMSLPKVALSSSGGQIQNGSGLILRVPDRKGHRVEFPFNCYILEVFLGFRKS